MSNEMNNDGLNTEGLFDFGNTGNLIPRSIFIDSEPSVIGMNSFFMNIQLNYLNLFRRN